MHLCYHMLLNAPSLASLRRFKNRKSNVFYCLSDINNQYHYRPEVPREFQEVKVPRLRDNGPGWW